jgi:hypothetical protein
VTNETGTRRVVVASGYRASGPGPLVAVPTGWTLERVAADDLVERSPEIALTSADVVVVIGAPALGVRITARTGAGLILADPGQRRIALPDPDQMPARDVEVPGVALDRGEAQPVLTCVVCRSPHGDELRVFSDDGRSSRTPEVVLDTGDPLGLRTGLALLQPPPTPWTEPAQVVADGGGSIEVVIDAGRSQQARRVRVVPGAFRVALIGGT